MWERGERMKLERKVAAQEREAQRPETQQRIAQKGGMEANRRSRLSEEEGRLAQASWSAWFVDRCLQPLVYSLSACVAIHVTQSWHHIQALCTRLREE